VIVVSQGSWECDFGSDQAEILQGPLYGESTLPLYMQNGLLNVEVSNSSKNSSFSVSVPFAAVPAELTNQTLQKKISLPEDLKEKCPCKFLAKGFKHYHFYKLEKKQTIHCKT
jgi:hypothetical protein